MLSFSTFSGITSTAVTLMVLRQQGCYAQTDVAGAGYCYFYIFKIIHHDIVFVLLLFFRKPTRPSLPLRKAPPFSPSLSSIVFTPPSVPPVLGDRNPQGREDVTAPSRRSEPLRSKVGGASKPFAILCGMGPPGEGSSQFIIYN